jgi:hypothetical protein
MPSRPNAFPRWASSADAAMSASRGAERLPDPNRSRVRAANTVGQSGASPMSGLQMALTT